MAALNHPILRLYANFDENNDFVALEEEAN